MIPSILLCFSLIASSTMMSFSEAHMSPLKKKVVCVISFSDMTGSLTWPFFIIPNYGAFNQYLCQVEVTVKTGKCNSTTNFLNGDMSVLRHILKMAILSTFFEDITDQDKIFMLEDIQVLKKIVK